MTTNQKWTLFPPQTPQDPQSNMWLYQNDDPEFHYATRVLRLAPQDSVELCDGRGLLLRGEIENINKKNFQVRFHSPRSFTWGPARVHLALALPKPAVLEDVLAMASELGVASITLFKGAKSQFNQPLKEDRYQQVIKESLRVNKCPLAPFLYKADSLSAALSHLRQRLPVAPFFLCDELASCAPSQHLLTQLSLHVPLPADWVIGVGPEAGWSDDERMHFLREGKGISVSLGALILRVPQAVASVLALSHGYAQQTLQCSFFIPDK